MEFCIITSGRAENQHKPNNILTSTYVNTHVWLHVTLILQSVFILCVALLVLVNSS